MGTIRTAEGEELKVDGTIEGNPSVLVDAVVVPAGKKSSNSHAYGGWRRPVPYMLQAYRHLKPLAFVGMPGDTEKAAGLPDDKGRCRPDYGKTMRKRQRRGLVEAMKQHRIWSREK